LGDTDARKSFHKVNEQRRRDTLKNGFEELRQALPRGEKSASKLVLLKTAADLITTQRNEIAILKAEIVRLRMGE
jgi:hypothetical protein